MITNMKWIIFASLLALASAMPKTNEEKGTDDKPEANEILMLETPATSGCLYYCGYRGDGYCCHDIEEMGQSIPYDTATHPGMCPAFADYEKPSKTKKFEGDAKGEAIRVEKEEFVKCAHDGYCKDYEKCCEHPEAERHVCVSALFDIKTFNDEESDEEATPSSCYYWCVYGGSTYCCHSTEEEDIGPVPEFFSENPGTCPRLDEISSEKYDDAVKCAHDGYCSDGFKCCANPAYERQMCTAPVFE